MPNLHNTIATNKSAWLGSRGVDINKFDKQTVLARSDQSGAASKLEAEDAALCIHVDSAEHG